MGTPLGDLTDPTTQSLETLSGDAVAIDGHLEFHQYVHSITDDWGDYVTNSDGFPISHLIGLVSRLGQVLDAGIKPIYVFDGGYPSLKEEALNARRERQAGAREEFIEAKKAGDKDAAAAAAHKKNGVLDSMILSGMEVLDAMGVPSIRAPGEGEVQAVQLCHDGIADHVVTEDRDALLHGAPSMLRDFGASGCSQIRLQSVLDRMGWSLDQLRWYGVLLGTDYNESAHGVGSVYGQQIVDEASSFDDVIAKARSYDDIDADRWRAALDLLGDQSVEEDPDISWAPFDIDRVHAVACQKYGLADWQVMSRLKNVDNTDVIEVES